MAGLLDFLGSALGIGPSNGLSAPYNPNANTPDEQADLAQVLPNAGTAVPIQGTAATPTAPVAPHNSPLRDILGHIGDAFLVQAGHQPYYVPHQQEKQQAAAVQDFVQNPLPAIQRLSQTPGGLQTALEMYKQYQVNQMTGAKNKSEIAAADARTATATAGLVGGLASTLNPNNFDAVYPILQAKADAGGYPLLPLPPNFDKTDPEQVKEYKTSLSQGAMNSYQQGRLADAQAMIPIQQEKADAMSTSAGAAAANAGTNKVKTGEVVRHNQAVETIDTQRGRPRKNVPLGGGGFNSAPTDTASLMATANVQHPPTPGNPVLYANGKPIATTSDGKHWDTPIK